MKCMEEEKKWGEKSFERQLQIFFSPFSLSVCVSVCAKRMQRKAAREEREKRAEKKEKEGGRGVYRHR